MAARACSWSSSSSSSSRLLLVLLLGAGFTFWFLLSSSPDLWTVHSSNVTSRVDHRAAVRLFSSRRLLANKCSNKDITISQGRDGISSTGIPQYAVQVVNTCMSDCSPSNVHLHCGWFASAPLVNPAAFRRLSFDDCLVANGRPLRHGEIIRFVYANSFMYPLKFKSAQFC